MPTYLQLSRQESEIVGSELRKGYNLSVVQVLKATLLGHQLVLARETYKYGKYTSTRRNEKNNGNCSQRIISYPK